MKKEEQGYRVSYTSQDKIDWEWLASIQDLYSLKIEGQKSLHVPGLLRCKGVVELSLVKCCVINFEFLAKMKNLETFAASGMPAADFSTLAHVNKIREVYLQKNKITDIRFLDSFSNLRSLCLDNNCIADISVLQTLKLCEEISVARNCIENIDVLARLPFHCMELYISDNRIKDITPILKENTISSLYIQRNCLSEQDKQLLTDEFAQNRMWLKV